MIIIIRMIPILNKRAPARQSSSTMMIFSAYVWGAQRQSSSVMMIFFSPRELYRGYPSPHPSIISQISSLVKKFFQIKRTRHKFFIAFSHS